MTSLPAPGAVAQLTSFLQQHPWWSAFWDKRVWRLAVAEDDPDSQTSPAPPNASSHT